MCEIIGRIVVKECESKAGKKKAWSIPRAHTSKEGAAIVDDEEDKEHYTVNLTYKRSKNA